jgi:hypothetical protein
METQLTTLTRALMHDVHGLMECVVVGQFISTALLYGVRTTLPFLLITPGQLALAAHYV